jgi:pimeloyl-ACP methyl ester carboxylesterase
MPKALGRLMTFMPTAMAANITMSLVSKPRPAAIKEAEAAALQAATRIHWGRYGEKAAYKWGNSSDVVLMFHGWGGRAAQLAQLAQRVSESGFTVIGVDFAAHGDSPGSSVSFAQMIADVTETYKTFGANYAAVVAHSAGALSMMAARRISGLGFNQLVCINPPVSPYPPIRALKRVLNPPKRVVDACEKKILGQFQGLLSQQGDPACYRQLPNEELLLVNDTNDKLVDCRDGDLILGQWPSAQRLVTQNLGHLGTLQDSRVADEVVNFCA